MIETRRAVPDDADELMRLRGVMLGSMHGDGAPLTGDWQHDGARTARTLLAGAGVAAFVVDAPGGAGLAACAVGEVHQRLPGPRDPRGLRGYVYNVATDPAYRRRGYSRACLTALLSWFAEAGAGSVDLRASAEGEPLYAALGFERTAEPAMRLRLT